MFYFRVTFITSDINTDITSLNMKIYNKTKSNLISEAKLADTFISRTCGLMFKKVLKEDRGLLIKYNPRLKSRTIHCFFMRFTIDLIFIDGNKRVIDLKTLPPWRIYTPKGMPSWVLEVNEGVIEEKNVELGDVLEF